MSKEKIEVYERVYDNPLNQDGSKKPNKLLGTFEIIDDEGMDDYSYEIYVKDKDGDICKLKGTEVSGFYHPNEGGTRNMITKLKDINDVKIYLKYQLVKEQDGR